MRILSPKAISSVIFMLVMLCLANSAKAQDSDVQTTWQLLDYIGVDYEGAVANGVVSNPAEYAEQQEFAATVATKIAALPAKPARQDLEIRANALRQAIDQKAEPARVAELAHRLGDALLAAYPIPVAPKAVPVLARGAALFSQSCAVCHGPTGDGRGPAAASLSTPPVAFTDYDRARQRSLFALYQITSQGVEGTPMRGFQDLSAEDRWALALFTGQIAFPERLLADGEKLWKSDRSLHNIVPDLKTLFSLTPAALEGRVGKDKADALMAYLRRNPAAVVQQGTGTLSLARERMAASLAASRVGNREQASALALSAYLDGFEPTEAALSARNAALVGRIEQLMLEYRAAVQRGDNSGALSDRQLVLDELFVAAEAALAPGSGDAVSTFVGAATILLREGLEALLIVVAMIAFLRKAERPEAIRYVHAGWTGALVAGVVTWGISVWALEISGVSRELTEGFGSLFAAIVLLSVGIWMHGKAQADQWQRYIREKMSHALSGRSGWFLFGLAFIVVYREVFETVLFYAALSAQGQGTALLAGTVSACAALAAIAWAMLRYSTRLPIGKFFSYSAWLMALLTVVLAGKGIAALQEAGMIGITPLVGVPRVPLVGFFPTLQTEVAQALAVVSLVAGFTWNKLRARRAASGSR